MCNATPSSMPTPVFAESQKNYLSGCRDPLVALHTRNSHLNSSPFLLNKEFLLWIYNCICNSSSSFTILPSMDKKIVSQRPLRTNFYFRHSVSVNSLHFRVRPRFSSKQARKAPSYASSKLRLTHRPTDRGEV